MRDGSPQTIYLKDYTVPDYLIESVDLNFILDEQSTRVVSRISMQRNPQSTHTDETLTLMGEELTLVSVAIDGNALSTEDYTQTTEHLSIHQVPQDKTFILSIENTISPQHNTAFEGLYQSRTMLCTQCEAEGFRKITYFLDRPDVMSTFKTTLIGDKDKYPVLLSNGNRVADGELAHNRHWVTWEDPFAKPCYLFALVAGQLECIEDNFVTQSGRNISLQIFVESHDVDKCEHAMQSLKNAMRWDEEVYGREYDLDLYMIVAVGHFNMGAMENKGLNIFNTKFVLARPDTATDTDYEHIEGVIAHEYFHNWSGNRVTCRDWFQLSLKEGFTVFRDQQYTGDQTSQAVKRIEDVNLLRTRQFAEDAGPLSHPIRPESYIEINNFYTLTVYEKGAEVVRMLHTLLGSEGFRKGSDLYFSSHDGQAVTCDDFVTAMENANDIDLSQFREWYSQSGTPQLTVSRSYDAANNQLHISVQQSTPDSDKRAVKKPLLVPIKIGLLGQNGSPLTLTIDNYPEAEELTLQLTERSQTFTFNHITEAPAISLLRGYSAPVIVDLVQDEQELAFLITHDPDAFNRWEAAQKLASKIIMDEVESIQNGRPYKPDGLLVDTCKALLTQDWPDKSYLSLLIKLPDETFLASQMQIIDVIAIHQARESVRKILAEQLQHPFMAHYDANNEDLSGRFDSDAIGSRRLKNICLYYLTTLENEQVYQMATTQFDSAANMTDQIAALSAIVNSHNPAKNEYLDRFYQQWQHEALVIDKWFALQAGSAMPDAFDNILNLLNHDAFDLKTPNRVRSLIGAFSQTNPLHFHARNGAGYRFLADQIIALNSLNPQVASRMVVALTHWRKYDVDRQMMMQNELQRIIKTENISKDVYEMASKSL